jgi:hypothetical protein
MLLNTSFWRTVSSTSRNSRKSLANEAQFTLLSSVICCRMWNLYGFSANFFLAIHHTAGRDICSSWQTRTVDFWGLQINDCFTCSAAVSSTLGWLELFLLHRHPVSANYLSHLKMLFFDGGVLSLHSNDWFGASEPENAPCFLHLSTHFATHTATAPLQGIKATMVSDLETWSVPCSSVLCFIVLSLVVFVQ